MHIGLIVGIGPAATDYYYRTIISAMAEKGLPLSLTMAHADTSELLENQAHNAIDDQVAIYLRLADQLKAAGAEVIAITSIAGHFCIEEFEAISPLPVINMIGLVREELVNLGVSSVGLMGTRSVMTSHFYGGLGSVSVLELSTDLTTQIHEQYVAIATTAVCTPTQKQFFHDLARDMITKQHVDVVLLAGTDLALAFPEIPQDLNILDCARLHALAIAEMAAK